MQMIKISDIGYDPNYYPRANGKEDWVTVHRYADALKASIRKQFPAIVVVRVHGKPYKYLILDGLHRIRAYYRAGREEIPATVERLPESKWFHRSVELNATHGRALDAGDKAFIATRLEQDGYSTEQVAALLQMTVDSLKKIVVEKVCKLSATAAKSIPGGRGNREIGGDRYGFLKAPFVEEGSTPANAEAALEAQGPVAARDVLHVLDSAIAVLQCGVDLTDAEIVARVKRLNDLTMPQG